MLMVSSLHLPSEVSQAGFLARSSRTLFPFSHESFNGSSSLFVRDSVIIQVAAVVLLVKSDCPEADREDDAHIEECSPPLPEHG